MSSWHSPGSIFSIGHRAVKDLFLYPVQVQEKIDGSFFAFGLYPEPAQNNEIVLKARSKGAVIEPMAPPAMFKPAVSAALARQDLLHPGWQYRGETLCKPKHNSLHYERVPKDNVILFDIVINEEEYLPYEELKKEAERIGLEVVPQLYSGMVLGADELRKYLDTESILKGQKIEGVVCKPLTPLYGLDKKLLMAKFVGEAFKEVHRKQWGESNPGPKDIILRLGEEFATPARWQKAILHKRERGEITDSPKDIGPLLGEISNDIKKEEEEYIKDKLFKYAWPHIARLAQRGFPQWYQEQLLALQFEQASKETIK